VERVSATEAGRTGAVNLLLYVRRDRGPGPIYQRHAIAWGRGVPTMAPVVSLDLALMCQPLSAAARPEKRNS